MNGVLVIDKGAGPTSHDVVDAVRKALRVRKVGHTGTLDPAATGVLPLVLGSATKLARYLSGADKRYRADVVLGVATTTLDSEGEITSTSDNVDFTEAQIEEVLESLRGKIDQIPPMFSAKKQQGKRLYKLARQGLEVEREPKPVEVMELSLRDQTKGRLTLDVHCSAGTYVRVLADDIGKALGCGAHLGGLRRLSAGSFTLENAVTVEAIKDSAELAKERLIGVDQALVGLARLDVPSDIAKMVVNGYQLRSIDLRTVDCPPFNEGDVVGVGVEGGALVAVARAEIASESVFKARRDVVALKSERVLVKGAGGGGGRQRRR